jgi:hypothetical protein
LAQGKVKLRQRTLNRRDVAPLCAKQDHFAPRKDNLAQCKLLWRNVGFFGARWVWFVSGNADLFGGTWIYLGAEEAV